MRALLALSVLVFAVNCGSDSSNDQMNHATGDTDTTCVATNAVSITNFTFSPRCATVAAGSTVVFTNNDSTTHTSTTEESQPTTWFSGNILVGASFTSPAIAAGTTTGHCDIHPSMHFEIRAQ